MQITNFRLFIAILASMGPFFAYICKLNLSMTVEDMVARSLIPLARPLNCSDNYSYDYLADVGLQGSRTEEHTLAILSSGSVRNWRLEHSIWERNVQRCKRKSQLAKLRPPAGYSNSLGTHLISFNIDEQPIAKDGDQQSQDQVDQSAVNGHLLFWSKEGKDFLLSAYFIGYVLTQVPVARMAEVLGAKPVFVVVGLGTSFCTLIFPFTCYLSVYAASAIRIILGAFQAGMFPACYVLLCEWLPKNERSRYLTWPSAFSRIGTIVMNLLIPIIIMHMSWEWVFYISGGATLIWTLFFMVIGSSSPNKSFWIAKSELIYIESHMEPTGGAPTSRQSDLSASGFSITELPLAKPAISWRKIMTNRALLVLTLVMFTSEWSNMLLLIKLPGFLGSALKMDLGEISIWSSTLVVVYCVVFPFSGFLASRLEAANIEGVGALRIRKLFEATAHTLQAVGSIMIAFSDDRTIIAIALLVMMFGRSVVGGGQCLMPPELSKEYPGTVFAYANSLANLAGFFGPNIITAMVDNPDEHSSWSSMWLLSALIFLTGGLLFCLFADNCPQNYRQRAKTRAFATDRPQVEPEIFKMEAFAPLASEPNPPIGSTSKSAWPPYKSSGERKRVARKL